MKTRIIYRGKVKYLKRYFELLEDKYYGYTLAEIFKLNDERGKNEG